MVRNLRKGGQVLARDLFIKGFEQYSDIIINEDDY